MLGLSLAVRLGLLVSLPELWTLDSRSYLRIADWMLRSASFAEPQLGVLRLPGYPAFLCTTKLVGGGGATALLVAQAVLGLISTAVAYIFAMGLTRSTLAAAVLGLFVGLNPLYLTNEHAIMSETFALMGLLIVVWIASRWLHSPDSAAMGLLVGLLAGGVILTRLNGLVLLASVLLAVLTALLRRLRSSASSLRWLTAAMLFVVGLAALLTPWILRNLRYLDSATVFASPAKMRLIYAIEAGLIDPAGLLPGAVSHPERFARDPAHVVFWELVALGSAEGERRASDALARARGEQAGRLRRAQIRTAATFLGAWPARGEGDAVMWLSHLLEPEDRLVHSRRVASRFLTPSNVRADPKVIAVLQLAIHFYTTWVRPGILALLLLATVLWLLHRRGDPDLACPSLTGWLLAGYAGTVLLHAEALADNLRFATVFDWVPVTVILSIATTHRRFFALPREATERQATLAEHSRRG